ncbi:MAG: phenyltransferase domain-containing protein [Desulfobacterales bacterium]|nr:phenyltransferase domain-containing protein [Desulfobacterales bacterium]
MELNISRSRNDLALDVDSVATLIVNTQRKSGEIPWCEGKQTDPWDHIEAAMGLNIGGYFAEARHAFNWAAQNQLSDGSWYATYINGVPEDKTRDANMSSYISVGVLHDYLITNDKPFLQEMWETIYRAIEFALSLQAPGGEIHWAISPEGKRDPMALLTGSSSIYLSLKSALVIAKEIGYSMPAWEEALVKLGGAIRHKPYHFNMTKSRFSMYWFYPILSGALTGEQAQNRIDQYWKKYVVEGHGAKCVNDEPWVTIAETAELSLALSAMGNLTLAEIVFNWISGKRFDDGSFWCGYTVPDITLWPDDKLTWTNAAVLMAADAIYDLTTAGKLFSHRFWESSGLSL